MNILLLGGGGREHAFSWKITQSPLCSRLYIAPGNAGTETLGENVALNPNDFPAIKNFSLSQNIEMVIVGPEEPLVRGIYDFFKQDEDLKHISVIGPSQVGAQLEGSKAFAKLFMQEFGIPTAGHQSFTAENLADGLAYIDQQSVPIVLKADGLAAGKGVLICGDKAEAKENLKEMLGGKFGQASAKVVIEDFLSGIEFSVFVLTNGQQYKVLPIAKDYKRIGEGDTGLNTGGMGAVSPVPFVDDILMQKVEERVIKPTLKGIQSRGFDYKGFIFLGLINVKGDPYVIEYNCRMGDPETEVVLPRLKNDLLELFVATEKGTLDDIQIDMDTRIATTIMLVSGGYPEAYEKGKNISGIEAVQNSLVFQAGTKSQNGEVLTNGGRVIAITSFGESLKEAVAQSMKNADVIDFEGKYFRTDIGFDL